MANTDDDGYLSNSNGRPKPQGFTFLDVESRDIRPVESPTSSMRTYKRVLRKSYDKTA